MHPNSAVLISVSILKSFKEIASTLSEDFCIQRCTKKSGSTIKITRILISTNHLLSAFVS